jgi:uncharacterized membrane protein YGL010W
MKTLEENLTQYAAYHRDRRNIATHFAGVPMIVLAVVLALALVSISIPPMTLTLAALVCLASSVYYLILDRALGLAMAVILFAMCAAASEITHRLAPGAALGLAAALFIVGWALQFLCHRFEGMKPAFYDDAKQLLIGPLFVLAEAVFLLGARRELREHIEQRVGPTVARRDGAPLPMETARPT